MSSFAPSRRNILQGAAAAASGLVLDACAHNAAAPASASTTGPAAAPAAPGAARGAAPTGGLTVSGTRLVRGGKPFFVSGFNYWAGPTLAREGFSGGWDQVQRDLDGLQAMGVNMLRVMAATEGPDTEPFRIVPTIQPALGQYDPVGVAGVVRFADELKRRDLFAIFTMNDFWQWSGGFGQYLAWAGEGAIPYPPPAPGGNWDRYQHFSGGFYKNAKAVEGYDAYLRFMVPKLKDNPMVIWELANEPRGMRNVGAYRDWIDATAKLIKSMSPTQLVTTGSEGQTASPGYAGMDTVKDHASSAIDFICFHMWAANWGWVHKGSLATGYPKALDLARKYVNDHADRAAKAGKPILLEEFGFPRDADSYVPESPTALRDKYFQEVYAMIAALIPTTPMAGIMPWAWAGSSRPPRPGQFWKPGDPFIGDPPHEEQGWYSVYDRDTTVALVKEWSPRITGAGAAPTASAVSPSTRAG
jgi:mannan endo-1,4-beta-mannosidase